MFIELMQDADKNEILSYMLPYEKFSVTLYSEILHGGKSIYVLRGNFGEIHGIFSWWQGSSIHHCLPEVYGKNRSEIESAFVKFFEENSIKYIFSISGEKSGTLMLKKILENSFEKTPKVQIEYFLMENGRFDSAKDLARMNRQLSVEKCSEQEISRVFPLQVEFEKEEVVFEPELFNEDHCLAKFENFVDAGAVFVSVNQVLDTVYDSVFIRKIAHQIAIAFFILYFAHVDMFTLTSVECGASVGFQISLIHNIETVFVIHLCGPWSIWIMAAAHCIKVMLFHHDQIFLCLSNIDNRTRHRIAVMTVYALELDLFTIDVNDASLFGNLTDTDPVYNRLCIREQDKLIQVWLFRISESGSFISFAAFPSPVKFAQISIFASVPFIVVVVK